MTRKEIGNWGEKLALRYLIGQDYLILDKNYYIRGGEADLIVFDKVTREIVFVEVKTRTSLDFGWPEEAIGYRKKTRMHRTAEKYLREKKYGWRQNYRFDSVAVEIDLKSRQAKIRQFKYI